MACRRAADHEGVYEPERSNAALTSGHRWNEYRSIRKNLLFSAFPFDAATVQAGIIPTIIHHAGVHLAYGDMATVANRMAAHVIRMPVILAVVPAMPVSAGRDVDFPAPQGNQNPQWPSCPSPAVSNRTTGPAGGLRMKSTMRSIWGRPMPIAESGPTPSTGASCGVAWMASPAL